jgi:hypothetical protein
MSEFDKDPSLRDAWIADARVLLEHSAQSLDAATLSRLNSARHAALARRRTRPSWMGWLPAAGLACSCALLLSVGLWSTHRPGDGTGARSPHAAIMAGEETAAGDDAMELYQDLDFYAWLDAQEQDSDGG